MKTTFPMSAPPEAWAALADPMRLAAALPGCRSVTRDADGDGTLQVVTEVAVASVRGLWAGTVAPVDADAVRVRGSGAPGALDLVVRADPERTALTVEGTVDGALGTSARRCSPRPSDRWPTTSWPRRPRRDPRRVTLGPGQAIGVDVAGNDAVARRLRATRRRAR